MARWFRGSPRIGRPGSDRLSRVLGRSTMGAEGFHGRVRDGIGCWPLAKATRSSDPGMPRWSRGNWVLRAMQRCAGGRASCCAWARRIALSGRPVMTPDHKPNERLVPVSSTRCRAYTSGLSTWWSSTALQGDLVLRWVSRLDAFSGYPVRTWLPGCAAGATTGPPEVCPSRSSRTRDRSSQASNTHGR